MWPTLVNGGTYSTVPHSCYVYTFDSLGTRHVSVIRNLLSYLAAEALDKKKIYIDVDKFTLHGSMGAMVKVRRSLSSL